MQQSLKIIFAGTPEFAVPALQALVDAAHNVCAVYTQPDRPAGRGHKLTASPVKQLAQALHIPVQQPATLKNAEQQEILKNYNADVMIVAAYGLILPEAVLTAPRYGCINVHASWLPRWRGAAPIQRAILAGDSETGITIMQMAAGLDTGDMLCLASCPISDTDTAQTLHDKLAVVGAETLLDTLAQLQAGTLVRTPQPEYLATYADKLTKPEALLNWKSSALALHRAIRAYNAWPIAYTYLDGQVLKIWEAQPLPLQSEQAPGTIIGIHKDSIDVACSEGILAVRKIQWPNKNPVSISEALRAQSHPLLVGKLLG